MTQKCPHDEQLLDYVYGELSDAERKVFADHLATCSSCPVQVASLGNIRQEFQQRTPIEPAGEAMQRMTALLMQAAAAEHGAAAAAADGGGKVLAFRARGLRRILFHPASSVMAVAAAALFWVVFHAPPIPESGLSAPTSPVSFEPQRPTEGAPAAGTTAAAALDTTLAKNLSRELAEVSPRANDERKADVAAAVVSADKGSKGDALKDVDFDGLRGGTRSAAAPTLMPPAEKKPAPGPTKPTEAVMRAAKPVMVAKEEPVAAAGKGGGARSPADVQYRSSSPAVVALADQAYAKSAKKEVSADAERPADRWAQPPPAVAPPPPPAPRPTPMATTRSRSDDESTSVRDGIARTQQRVQQKMVDELANQPLAGISAGGAAPSAAPPATEHRYAQGNAPAYGSTNQADNADSAPGRSSGYNQNEHAPVAAATPTTPAAGMNARGAVTGATQDDNATALTTVKDQLRRGQCNEANATLTRLERTAPLLHGLAETRAEWQSSCAAPLQQLERRMNVEAPEPAAAQLSAPTRSMSKARMASPAPPAKPAPRKAAKSKSNADSF